MGKRLYLSGPPSHHLANGAITVRMTRARVRCQDPRMEPLTEPGPVAAHVFQYRKPTPGEWGLGTKP